MIGRDIVLVLLVSSQFLAMVSGWPYSPQLMQIQAVSTQSTTFESSSATSHLPPSPGPPCLVPSSNDVSAAQIQPTGTNGSLHGHVIPEVQTGKAAYKEKLPQSQTIRMEIVFAIRNSQQFQACLASLNDPQSTNYGRFLDATTLTPYIPTPGQKTSIVSYLTHRGFTVTNGASPLVIQMATTVATAEKTFGVNINLYKNSNSAFYAPDSDPKVPQNFVNILSRISGLDNFSVVRPSETPCGSLGYPDCPQGVQVGYSFSTLYGSGYDGTGQKVAIVDVPGDPDMQSAINAFDSQYGLAATTLDIRYPDGTSSSYDPGWASETAMDVEAVHSVAPGAGIILLYDSNVMNAIDYVATNHLATLVSNSWGYVCASGSCDDVQLPSSFVSSVDSRLMLDNAQGLTILFASGDQGAKPDGTHLGTEFPASDPNVLAVGATNLALSGCTGTTCSGYGSESGASISGGGYSGYFAEPSWQTSNIGSKSGRAVPDVSMLGYNPGFWVYSTSSDKCGSGGNSAGWFGCAGTSLSTPLWAGFLAVALQVRGGGSFGNISPRLYQLGNSISYSSIFHDVTSGSNGYPAGSGWDPVTGWGSPVASSLATSLVPQVTMTVSYAIVGGGTPSPPVFNYVQGGGSHTYKLTTTPTGVVVDPGSPWSVAPNALTGSTSAKRWASNQALSGTASSSTIVFTFYKQSSFTLSYSIVGGGSGYSAPSFTANAFGTSSPQTLTITPTGYWFDSASPWTVTNPLSGSSSTEEWLAGSASGKIGASQTLAFSYQHQYWLSTLASPSSGGTVSPGSGWQNASLSVKVQAAPNTGFGFSSWTGTGPGSYSGSTNPVTVVMNGAVTETANFGSGQLPQLTVTLVNPSNGAGVPVNTAMKLKVKVTSAGSVIQGATVTVYLDGSQVCSGTSNLNGVLNCSFTPTVSGHTYSWYATSSKIGYAAGTSQTWTFHT